MSSHIRLFSVIFVVIAIVGGKQRNATAEDGKCTEFGAEFRDVTFTNNCSQDVWVRTKTETSQLPTDFKFGHKLPTGTSFNTCFRTPLESVTFIPQTDCTGSGESLSCATGSKVAPSPLEQAEITMGTNGATGGLGIPIPSSQRTFTNLYVGNPFLVKGKLTVTAMLSGTKYEAKDDEHGQLVAVGDKSGGISGKVDYETGTVTEIELPMAPKTGDSITTVFSYHGTDTYDVSLINGYAVPIAIVPSGGGQSAGAQTCSASKDYCPAGFSCDTTNGICRHTCTAVNQCGGYPWQCVNGYCTDPTSDPYKECGVPGCTTSGNYACTGAFANSGSAWNFSSCPSYLQWKVNGQVVACNPAAQQCPTFLVAGQTSTIPNDCITTLNLSCSASEPCPTGLTCNNGVCTDSQGGDMTGGKCSTPHTVSGCSSFEICNSNGHCEPTNTSLYVCDGTGFKTSCQVGDYAACFQNSDCYPGFTCDLTDGSPTEFTCLKSNLNCNTDYSAPPPVCSAASGQEVACSSSGVCQPPSSAYPNFCCGPKTMQWTHVAAPLLQLFKTQCPTCYSYQFDDVTSTFGCQTNYTTQTTVDLGYTVVFCPVPGSLPTFTSGRDPGADTAMNGE